MVSRCTDRHAGRQGRRHGYSLLELSVVVVLTAMAAAGAAVIGLHVVRATHATATKTMLETVTAAELAHAGRTGSYSTSTDVLGTLDGITVVSAASTRPGEVSLSLGDGGTLVIAMSDEEGVCHVRVLGDILGGAARTDSQEDGACLASRHLPAGQQPTS